jgi:hypothetical protein
MLQPLFDPQLAEKISAAGVAAVLVIDDAGDALPLARALLDGGVNVMELTLRTPAALDALRQIRREVPEMIAGIGTILSVEQLHAAREAGYDKAVLEQEAPRLLELPFESERKRMTVIIKAPHGEIKVLSKGADCVMIPLLANTKENNIPKRTESHQHYHKTQSAAPSFFFKPEPAFYYFFNSHN